MPAAHYASPYAKLELTLDEIEQLSRTATQLVDEVQDHYENFLERKSTLDLAQWSLVRERDDVRVFHDRRPSPHNDLVSLLTIGTVVGRLNDAMYGELNPTTEAMRVRTAYVKDTLLDCAVLANILKPSDEKPFQSMTVRWFVKAVPLLARAMGKHRDIVYLEYVDTRRLLNGEEVGFRLMHSISSPKMPVLPAFDRSNLSICTMWRQATPESVHVFQTAYIEVNEPRFVMPMAIKSISDALISIHRVLDCAQLKKLAYLVESKYFMDSDEDTQFGFGGGCSVCGSSSSSARRGVKSTCAICGKFTCGRCRVKRGICAVGVDRQLLELKMRFCTPCISSAARLDAFGVAQSELRESYPTKRRPGARTVTSMTSSVASFSDSYSVSSISS